MATILISGGSGMIGRALTDRLISGGYQVHTLSRNPASSDIQGERQFAWNPDNQYLDPTALEGVIGVIHLAGAGIADQRWTKKRRREIISSRIQTAELLKTAMRQSGTAYRFFISASGANYYGTQTVEHIYDETDPPGDDFLATCCVLWENAAFYENPAQRVVALRTAMVLSKSGGAFPQLSGPVRNGFGVVLGSGEQYSPWIHLEDLVEIYFRAVTDFNFQGVYNAVADEHITHAEMMHKMANAFDRKIWLPKIPAAFLKIGLGEMSSMLLKGSRLSNRKLHSSGHRFRFPEITAAFNDLIRTP